MDNALFVLLKDYNGKPYWRHEGIVSGDASSFARDAEEEIESTKDKPLKTLSYLIVPLPLS